MKAKTSLNFEIKFTPMYSILEVNLEQGEMIRAEPGAMVSLSPNIELKTKKAGGGFFKTLKRTFAGESFFINEFMAQNGRGLIGFAAPYTGDLGHIPLEQGEQWVVSGGGYIASTVGLETDTRFEGLKGIFSGEKMFFLKATAREPTDMFLTAYGAFRNFDLEAGEEFILDTGHLVAMESTVQYSIKRVGGLKSTIFSGEGLVLNVNGPGRVITQTRDPAYFVSWLTALLPIKGRG